MQLLLTKNVSIEIKNQFSFVTSFSNELKENFINRSYGDDLIEIIINIICVSQNFEQFFIPQKPKYIKYKEVKKSNYTGEDYKIEKCLIYDIKLSFDEFSDIENENDRKKMLAQEIFNSLTVLDEMNKKIKDFNITDFKSDLESFLIQKELL